MTKYTFELDNNVPNDWLVVTAKNKKEAKRLLMKRMDQVNRKCMRVIIFDQKKLEAEEKLREHEFKRRILAVEREGNKTNDNR
jgi:hypothetical protein|tara:strand:+ start:544 stop:792 length:249 start_codon:yes stop_codon:yes gene_type:complete